MLSACKKTVKAAPQGEQPRYRVVDRRRLAARRTRTPFDHGIYLSPLCQ
jgi:hypothetical protein